MRRRKFSKEKWNTCYNGYQDLKRNRLTDKKSGFQLLCLINCSANSYCQLVYRLLRNTFLLNLFLLLHPSPFFHFSGSFVFCPYQFFLYLFLIPYYYALLLLCLRRSIKMNIKCIKFSTESPRCLSLVVSLGFLAISYESLIRWGNKKIYQKKEKRKFCESTYQY